MTAFDVGGTEPARDRMPLDRALKKAGEMLSWALRKGDPVISEATAYLSESSGKGIRSKLLLTCASGDDGLVPPSALHPAVAVELFHLATLVHDDVIDDADMRRGVASAQKKFGKRSAVIIGDYLFCLAMAYVLPSFEDREDRNYGLIKKYAPSLTNICLGEFNQMKNNGNIDLSIRSYLKIITGKTAELFYISALTGALIGGASEEEARRTYGLFGKYLGMVFQIIDDCQDYELAEETALKPVKHDFTQGVVTLPLIFAVMRDPDLKRVFKSDRSPERIIEHARIVKDCGVVAEAKALAFRYAQKAEGIVRELFDSRKRDRLLELLSTVAGRTPG
jgi:heptaprenyl diphosphate synthase